MTKNWIEYACTRSAICLGDTSKFQGSYTLLCLNTGKCITSKQFIVVPMHDSVVKQVEALATIDVQLDEDLTFEYCDNIPIEDSNDNAACTNITLVDLETPRVEL